MAQTVYRTQRGDSQIGKGVEDVAMAQCEGLPLCLTKGTRHTLHYPSLTQTDLGTAHNVPRNVMRRRSLFPKWLTVSHYTRKTNFRVFYISKKSSAVSLTKCYENQKCCNSISCRYVTLHCTQIGQKLWEIRTVILK